jgi:general secretion pathway protein H
VIGAARAPRVANGFTLIEILVVVTIIAIVTGGALLSFGLIGGRGGAGRDVERLQSLLIDARDRAELENRDYGVRLLPDGYEFLAFDGGAGRWLPVNDRLFQTTRWSMPLEMDLDVEGRRVVLPREDRQGSTLVPDFGVDATGEFTPFELRLRPPAPSSRWRLGIDDDGELAVREDGAS